MKIHKFRTERFILIIIVLSICFSLALSVHAEEDTVSYKIAGGLICDTGDAKFGYTWEIPRTTYQCQSVYVVFQCGTTSSTGFTLKANGTVTGTEVYHNGNFYIYQFGNVASKSSGSGDTWTLTFKSTTWINIYSIKGYPYVTSYTLNSNWEYRVASMDSYIINTSGYTSVTLPKVLSVSPGYCLDLRILGSYLQSCDFVTIPFSVYGTENYSVSAITVYRNGEKVDSSLITIQLDGVQDTSDSAEKQYQSGTLVIRDPYPSGYYVIRFSPRSDAIGNGTAYTIGIQSPIISFENIPDSADYQRWEYDLQASIDSTLKEHTGIFTRIRDKLVDIWNELVKGSPEAEELNQSVNEKTQELENLNENLNSYNRPDTDSLSIDINDVVSSSNISTAGSLLSIVLSNNIFVQVLLLAFIFALAAYVFFGKRV